MALQCSIEKMVFSINGSGSNRYLHGKKTNLGPKLILFILRCTADLNVKGKTTQILEENTGK